MRKKVQNKRDIVQIVADKSRQIVGDENRAKEILIFLKEDKKSVKLNSHVYKRTLLDVPYNNYSRFFQYLLFGNSDEKKD